MCDEEDFAMRGMPQERVPGCRHGRSAVSVGRAIGAGAPLRRAIREARECGSVPDVVAVREDLVGDADFPAVGTKGARSGGARRPRSAG